jgi:hypothetical protein
MSTTFLSILPDVYQDNPLVENICLPFSQEYDTIRQETEDIIGDITLTLQGTNPGRPDNTDFFRYVATLTGLWGVLWEDRWSEFQKLNLLTNPYTELWPKVGTLEGLEYAGGCLVSDVEAFRYSLEEDGLAESPYEDNRFYTWLKTPQRTTAQDYLSLQTVFRVMSPAGSLGGVCYDEFYADLSLADHPVWS